MSFQQLLELAEKLRSPTGCPWDRKQTIQSMREHLEEEAEEVADAIKNDDKENLSEELGDLLFQIVMITQIAKEEKLFDMQEVISKISDKIISRHTWVFGEDKVSTPEEALELWKRNKELEKSKK